MRLKAGLSPKSIEAAQVGLPNTVFGVTLLFKNCAVGMGRVVGDKGCDLSIVDIAIMPEHQGKGWGRRIMTELMMYISKNVPDTAYISLIADGAASKLYESFGFKDVMPKAKGMFYRKSDPNP
jgi:ribosomal protein S18 acetylase RimI-like enzyme